MTTGMIVGLTRNGKQFEKFENENTSIQFLHVLLNVTFTVVGN